MLESITSFFFRSMAPEPEEEATGQEADPRLASCALLLELAYADEEFSEAERVHLEGCIRRQYGVEGDEAAELIRLAEEERARAVDLWQFTSLIDEHYSIGQKMVLAEAMWGLVYADGVLAGKEDFLIRKISNLLHLRPGYLAEARKRVEGQRDR